MLYPFKSLICRSVGTPQRHFLIGTSGFSIYIFDLISNDLVSVWPSSKDHGSPLEETPRAPPAETSCHLHEQHVCEVPIKRRKITPSEDASKNSLSKFGFNQNEVLNTLFSRVITLTGTSDGKYVIVVTEDKTIRVLELSLDGILSQLSERQMPKRPCAVILTPDESTILCADKFGDVYSIPLISASHNKTYNDQDSVDQSSKEDSEPSQTPFVPAANSRTVHTLRNQKALQNQQKITHKKVSKKTLLFDYQLLLGHVSLLTDLVCVRLTNTITASSQPRTYILTSDRDEHIRVSRGIPQAHIIEGYCLGHTEFISKLCIPKWHQKLLVSGGGDDYLLAWDWLSGRVRQKVDLRGPMQEFRRTYRSYENSMISFPATKESSDFKGSGEDYETKIAVSGIWAIGGFDIQPKQLGGYIILACEGVPALFIFSVDSDAGITFNSHFPLPGNIVDVAILEAQRMIIYSIDHCHMPFSTTVFPSLEKQSSQPLLGAIILDTFDHWIPKIILEKTLSNLTQSAETGWSYPENFVEPGKSLSEFLYGIETLRKRGQENHD